MKGFLHIDNDTVVANRLNTFEVNRYLRLMAIENPANGAVRSDPLFLGTKTHFPGRPHPDGESPSSGTSLSTDLRRIRQSAESSFLAPAPPGQIAFALGRVYVGSSSSISPIGIWSEVDVGLNRIGGIFGHPVGREAFFNETAVAPTGVGVVTPGGVLSFLSGEEGHFIYLIRVSATGSATTGEYYYERWPYWRGAYFPGSSEIDAVGAENNDTRLPDAFNERGQHQMSFLLPRVTSSDPSVVPYNLGYPTPADDASSRTSLCAGLAYDGLGSLWWAQVNVLANDNVNASSGRSVWSWQRMTPEMPQRRDAADSFSDQSLTGFPALPSNVQFRHFASGRGGFLYLASDGQNDADLGTSNTGALIQINANTDAVSAVHGTTVTGIYTVGGMRSNDCLAISVDRSESRAAAGFDRVWVLHRNGLSFADFNISTGATTGWSTVADTGATLNNIDADSVRGLGGVTWPGGSVNEQMPLFDVDSNGDVYWVSSPGSTGPFSSGVNRLNRLIGDGSAHTYYSLDTSAEAGAVGFITLGANTGLSAPRICSTLSIHRRDPGDPAADDIYLAGAGTTSDTANAVIRRFATSDWGTSNPGAGYYSDTTGSSVALRAMTLQLGVDGSFWCFHGGGSGGLLGSVETYVPVGGSGTGASFATAVGNNQDVTLAGGSLFDSRWVGRIVRFAGASNAVNNGSFRVVSVTSGSAITVFNPAGVAETSAFTFTIAGDEIDSRATDISAPNTAATVSPLTLSSYRAAADNSGIFWHIGKALTTNYFTALSPFPVTYNWSGSQWYRARRAQTTDGPGRPMTTSPQTLDSGVTVTFANSGAGGSEFVQDEFYTFPASAGLIKDSTQEISFLYDFYPSETELVARPAAAEGSQNKTCAYHTAQGGILTGSLASVLTDNPFTLTPEAARQLAFPNRQFPQDGSNNSVALGLANLSYDITQGLQIGLDMQADTVTSQLRVVMPVAPTNSASVQVYDLYSATAAAGPTNWTLRLSVTRTQDNPGVIIRSDAQRTGLPDSTTSSAPWELIFDMGDLANTGIFGPNIAVRYWKVIQRVSAGPVSSGARPAGIYALNSLGNPVGFTQNQYLNTAPDSNWLAGFPIRAVFVQDNNATAGGTTSSGPGANQVTLNAGTFATDIAAGDFFRTLSGANILQEIAVTTRDSGTQLTLASAPTTFTNATWEIVRNADVRPRDDAGGNEDVSQYPPTGVSGQSQLYIDPVTGFIYFNDLDVSNARTFRVERYVKVIRPV